MEFCIHKSDGLQAFGKPLSSLPVAIGGQILKHINKLAHHEPVIGIMGKTVTGKSSLCNELNCAARQVQSITLIRVHNMSHGHTHSGYRMQSCWLQ